MTPDPTPTVQFVELRVATDLARAVAKMRQAQRAYFEARKSRPHVLPVAELRAARELETRVDSLVADTLARERVALPGMEAG